MPQQLSDLLTCGEVDSKLCNLAHTELVTTHTVSTFSQLQAAITGTTVSPVIDIQADIILPEQLFITKHATLLSSTGSQLSGNHTNRILHIEGYIQVAAYGIVFRDGRAKVTITCDDNGVCAARRRRRYAPVEQHGGAVYVEGGANFTAYNCFFVNNHANHGGAIYGSNHHAGSFNGVQSVFYDNSASEYGGAVHVEKVVCLGCLLVGNQADRNYAAICAGTKLKLTDTHLSNNNPSGTQTHSISAPWSPDKYGKELSISCTAAAASTMTDDTCHNCENLPNCQASSRLFV